MDTGLEAICCVPVEQLMVTLNVYIVAPECQPCTNARAHTEEHSNVTLATASRGGTQGCRRAQGTRPPQKASLSPLCRTGYCPSTESTGAVQSRQGWGRLKSHPVCDAGQPGSWFITTGAQTVSSWTQATIPTVKLKLPESSVHQDSSGLAKADPHKDTVESKSLRPGAGIKGGARL